MQMVKCPKCGADNSARREGCFNCGSLLAPVSKEPEPQSYPGLPAPAVSQPAPIPGGAILIGVLAGILSVPFAIAFAVSSDEGRRAYGTGLFIGFGAQAALAVCLQLVLR